MRATFNFWIPAEIWLSANSRPTPRERARKTREMRTLAHKFGLLLRRQAKRTRAAGDDRTTLLLGTHRGGSAVVARCDGLESAPGEGIPQWHDARHAQYLARVSWPTRRRADSDNAAPTVKPLLDGLVDAGWLTDDNDGVIHRRAYEAGPPTHRKGEYLIVLTLEDCLCAACRKAADGERGEQ